MRLVMLTSTLNHHQLPLCKAFAEKFGEDEFRYIATRPVSEWRKDMGFSADETDYKYVLRAYKDSVDIDGLVGQADIVLYGDVSEKFVRARLKSHKLTFRYTERPYKIAPPKYQMPVRFVKYLWQFDRFSSLYLLCSGAYVASDYQMTGNFKGKAFRWGYFPQLFRYDIGTLMDMKPVDRMEILWVGRMIDWKHPESFVLLAEEIAARGANFHITAIGSGNMFDQISRMIDSKDLNSIITLAGALPTEKVREHMENSNIVLVTSDRKEGWGVVVNEAMNSGCVVVASDMVGAAPFLISPGKNGFIFESESWQEMVDIVLSLNSDYEKTRLIGSAAYSTIADEWNADAAARNFMLLCENIADNKRIIDSGKPCSMVG